MSSACICPRIDGFVIVARDCPHHPEARARQVLAKNEVVVAVRDSQTDDAACAWADYRKDYGVAERDLISAHKAFLAGWQAGRGSHSTITTPRTPK